MDLQILSLIIFPLYLFLHLAALLDAATSSNSPAIYRPKDDFAVNCGSSVNSTAPGGRQWIGDTASNYIIISQPSNGKLLSSRAVNDQPLFSVPVPYATARISRSQFTYTFQVTPGQKFIRLHFYPASYPGGFKRSEAFLTVKAGPYTLLSNFSASLTADALGSKCFAKEFCVNVEDNQSLNITFSPSPAATSDSEVYAFVNGIEVVSMPIGLYHSQEGDPGPPVVGKTHRFFVDKSIALEMVQRLNAGGSTILSMEDTGMFRQWSHDSNYLLASVVLPVITTFRIKYTNIPEYSAPRGVYQTSWSTVPQKQMNKTLNFTWKLSVDVGFRYLLRFHFCELEYDVKESAQKEFSIFINNQMAEANGNLLKWSGEIGVALYRDYIVTMEGERMEGKGDLQIALCPHNNYNLEWSSEETDAILKGLEVFKLSNPDNNLAGVNPMPLFHSTAPGNSNRWKLVYATGGNAIATGIVILITMLNIIVYQLRIWSEHFEGKNILPLPSEGFCCHFSLAEIKLVTNNFDDLLVVGRGGFGKVYKGLIDGGTTPVAVKRFNSNSGQGPTEFWTEIEMLSKLRHKHLVSLIGYCNESFEMILVYEFMNCGTLADRLYKMNNNGEINPLSWERRLKICIGAARGLEYLHSGTQHGVIHRDVKATNILLDENWIAKIADFGLCKIGTSHSLTHVSTAVKGTFGYLDPEYFMTERLTKKSDVYAFGVVLLEMLCGRQALDSTREEEQRSLVLWAQPCIERGQLDQIIDPSLRGQIPLNFLKVFAEIADKCLRSRGIERPTMADVVASLESALAAWDHFRDSSPEEVEDVDGLDDEIQIDDDSVASSPSTPIRYDDNDIQIDDDNVVYTPSTRIQYDRNGRKRSMGMVSKVFQGIAHLVKSADIRRRRRNEDDSNSAGALQWVATSQLYRHFSLAELRAATNNFQESMVIGVGGFGNVYEGYIEHGTLRVAIKCFTKSATGLEVFRSEVEAHSLLRHRHIVSLIGYCLEGGQRMLVHGFMVNGSLDMHLHGMRRERGYHHPLVWEKRLEICIGAAWGLQYLHLQAIIHRDIKSSNIMLDEDFVAKLKNFELFKLIPTADTTHFSTRVCGTIGYLDPHYCLTSELTKESDVYSFGVVLLEVMCGRRPVMFDYPDENQRHIVHWFRASIQRRTIDQIIDPCLLGKIAPPCLLEFVHIARNCLLERGWERPTMDEVVEGLQFALLLQQNWHNDIAFPDDYNNFLSSDNRFAPADADNTEVTELRFSPSSSGSMSPIIPM